MKGNRTNYIRILFLLLLFPGTIHADSLMSELNRTLAQKHRYVERKIQRINAAMLWLAAGKNNPAHRYEGYLKILNEYKNFNNDSAFAYAEKLNEEATRIGDRVKMDDAKVNLAFVLLSGGLFKETLEVLDKIDLRAKPDTFLCEYYTFKARCYYDLSSFVRNNHYGPIYDETGHKMADSAILHAGPGTYEYYFIHGLKNLRLANNTVALADYNKLINWPGLSDRQYAVIASTLSYLYSRSGDEDESLRLLIKSAIADVKLATRENYALFRLSETLLKKGNVPEAYRFIKIALKDAQDYGARQRQLEVGILLPIIEGQQLILIEKQKNTIFIYAAVVTFLILTIIGFIISTIRQNRKLKKAQVGLAKVNADLQLSNQSLTEVNTALKEASMIKEEYIAYYFNINSEYIDKIERFKKSVGQRLSAGKYEEIRQIVNKIDLKKEREDLSYSFDRVFLKLFPNFVHEFNLLFGEEDRIHLQPGQLLNTELRIFALIRLGIRDNDRIAKILDFSVNTVYSYKTRIKNKSFIPNHEFEDRVMEIRAD